MSLLEQAPSRAGSRFGKFSSNMFFTRNTAKPKRVHHIEGLNGALICNVNDDASVVRSTPTSSLSFNRTNLPAFETPRRVERLVPPTSFWNTYGIIQDTERWKQELSTLATASGLGVEKDEQKYINKPPQTTATVVDQQHASRSGAHYSTRTGRFNERTAKSRGRTGSRHTTAHSDILFNVPENEREMWMLQVLCQLLNTSNLEDVQSWLVSASQTEKDQARSMIHSALRGLKESERLSKQPQQNVDLTSLSNFVERQKNEEKYASQKYIKDSFNRPIPGLQSIDEEQQTDISLNDPLESSRNNSDVSQQNTTTYKRAYQNYNQRSQTTSDGTFSNKKTHSTNGNEENNDEEQIDTIQLDDDRQRPPSPALTKPNKLSKKPSSPTGRPTSSHKQKHRIETMQFNDEDGSGGEQNFSIVNENEDEQQQHKEVSSVSNKTKQPSTQDGNISDSKSRKIRRLQHKISVQEEETKKKFDELQSKQSRLENALKLLVKQTSTFTKRREPTNNNPVEDLDTPVVNVIIQTPRDTDRRDKQETISVQTNRKSLKDQNGNSRTKFGDYAIDDVKVQISLSRLDNHTAKVYTGVWKPDASTLHRLQGN